MRSQQRRRPRGSRTQVGASTSGWAIFPAMMQARRFYPSVIVIAGLSTNPPPGTPVTVAELVQDVFATRSVVDGYWLNVPAPGSACPRCGPQNPRLGRVFLQTLARRGVTPG